MVFFGILFGSQETEVYPMITYEIPCLLGLEKLVADRVPSAAAVSLMDLSVEAECFGSQIRFSDDEVPTVVGALVSSAE